MSKKVEPDFSQAPGPALHSARWRFGVFELDETRRELCRDQVLIALEPKPMNLLMLLLRHPGELVTKNDLLDALWTGRVVNENVVGNCVSSVREALGDDGPVWLRTVHGFGYRFDAPVQLIEDENKSPTITAATLDFKPGDQPPMRPNWQLLRRLGQTGDTWLAEHVKLRERRVFKFTTDARGLSALKREVTIHRLLRQSLSGKDHYVDVIDWNFDEPPYFIETEYCNGGSLLEWFDSQGGAVKVSLDARIELIARIADALADVHLVGVLHKDLKPANVFVVPGEGDIPKIRLADFGASRILDPNLLAKLEITRHGFTQVIDPNADVNAGTLLYLAPEVASGHPATAKADIYALGVMLYQFIVGNLRRQLGAGWEAEIDDEMLRDDIAAAAENNPERRLANAAELAGRLRALAARRRARLEAIEAARRAEAAARAFDRAKARRMGLMVAFMAMSLGFATSTTLYYRSVEARMHAEKESARANAVSRFLAEGMFNAVDGTERPMRTLTVKELLDTASRQLVETFPDHPDIEADVRLSLGNAYASLEYPIEAGEQLERSIKLYSDLKGEGARETLRASRKLIVNYYDRGKLAELISGLAEIASIAERKLGVDDTDRIRFEIELARGQTLLGNLMQAREGLKAVLSATQSERSDQADADAQFLLGWVHFKIGDIGLALKANRIAYDAYEGKLGQSHISTLNSLRQRAIILIDLEKFDEAETLLKSTERAASEWATDSSSVMLGIRQGLAEINMRRGKSAEAIDILEENLSRFSVGTGLIDESGPIRRKLANAYRFAGRLDEAEAMFQSAINISSENFGTTHPDTVWARIEFADLALSQKKLDLADSLCGATAVWNHPAAESSKLVKARLTLVNAEIHKAQGQIALSAAEAKAASKLLNDAYGRNHSISIKAEALALNNVLNADQRTTAKLSGSTNVDEAPR